MIKTIETHKPTFTSRPYQIGSNILLGFIFLGAVVYLGHQYASTRQHSIILNMIFYGLSVVCALSRKPSTKVDMSFFSCVFTFAGIALPMFLKPSGTSESIGGLIIQLTGIGISILGLISLNRSFGLVAAHRGVVSKGLYRFVRHPLYFSYEVSIIGFIINNFYFYNVLIALVHLCCQLQRIRYEEDLLSKEEAYQAYSEKTRWRLIPFVY
jgi:protein-S-isoprenylcysteine O-methyltransferase Ste14